ncbi:MAG: hypothetical protein EF810_06610 [Candidatus Methanodesulfokora washburnensis]|uniref:Uncharacterized protein n=1 Tax=Candidatus Methanodesulfokora washburnensis TaxID=2478471 RepID=A0A520KI38_9CREN|nr:MAG: hypothetical protein EF810_06610 [Candidatus Methanodesulfokores washburnensis]
MYEESMEKMLFQLYKKAYSDITEGDILIEEDESGWFYLVSIPKKDLKIAAVVMEAVSDDEEKTISDTIDRIKRRLGDEFDSIYVHIWTTSAYRDKLEEIIANEGFMNVSIELIDELFPMIKRQTISERRNTEIKVKEEERILEKKIKKEEGIKAVQTEAVPMDILNKVLDTQQRLTDTLYKVASLLEKLLSKEDTEAVARSIIADIKRQEIIRKPEIEAGESVIRKKAVERRERPEIPPSYMSEEERDLELSGPQETKGADEFIDEYLTGNPWAEILSKKVRRDENKSG